MHKWEQKCSDPTYKWCTFFIAFKCISCISSILSCPFINQLKILTFFFFRLIHSSPSCFGTMKPCICEFVTVSDILKPSLSSFYLQIWQLSSMPFSFSSHHTARNRKVTSFIISQSLQSQLMLQTVFNDLMKVSLCVWGHTRKELHDLQVVFFCLSSTKFKRGKNFLLTSCPLFLGLL